MASLIPLPGFNICNHGLRSRERNLVLPSKGVWKPGGQASRLETGRRVFCSTPTSQDYRQEREAIEQSGAGRSVSNLEDSFLTVDKNLYRESGPVLLQSANTHDLQFLPGLELDTLRNDSAPLLYKEYMDHLWITLTKKAPEFKTLDLEPEFMTQSSKLGAKTSRIFNWLSSASRLRRIRVTYFDGGSALQAFNSVLYPDFRYDIPMLGIDLLSFGANKILCAIDFTPLTQDPVYLDKYTSQLTPFRAKIAKHCGKMTNKFYDENQFFSKQLIFYRSELGANDPILEVPDGLLFSTYVEYIDEYLRVLQTAEPNNDPVQMSFVASRQNGYNKHSEERDPAIKIFNKHFGEEWSERFARNFLFPQDDIENRDGAAVN